MSFDLKTAIGSIAPTLATMLGGPLAGAAVTALAGAFGLAPGSGAEDITKVLQTGAMTPEIVANVRAADQKHAEALGQQGIDVMKINADAETALLTTDMQDRSSARMMQTSKPSPVPALLSLVVTSGFFVLLSLMMIGALKVDANSQALLLMLGSLTTGWTMMMSFWFGTTHNSGRKDELLAQSNPATATDKKT